MDRNTYETMYHFENRFWWYVGIHELLLYYLKYFYSEGKTSFLDAGCGTGRVVQLASEIFPECKGIDISPDAVEFASKRCGENIIQGSVTAMPFGDNSFDVVTSLDILYLLSSSDMHENLSELYRVTKPGGKVIFNLPAYEFLGGTEHDMAFDTRRRFTRSAIIELVKRYGFETSFCSYRMTLLFPLAAVHRLISRVFCKYKGKNLKARTDIHENMPFVNRILTGILRVENRLIRNGISLPFGLSVFCIARKTADT